MTDRDLANEKRECLVKNGAAYPLLNDSGRDGVVRAAWPNWAALITQSERFSGRDL